MFDTSYVYTKVTSAPGTHLTPHLIEKSIYSFDSKSGRRYLVEIHEHPNRVFVVKFYLRLHKNQPKKYNFLTAFNEAGGVLRTVIDICIHFREKYNDASFAFIGVPTIGELTVQKEQEELTGEKYHLTNVKRFKVYKMLTETFMGTQTFTHVSSPDSNSYLLIDKQKEDQAEAIIEMLSGIYEDLGDLLGT